MKIQELIYENKNVPLNPGEKHILFAKYTSSDMNLLMNIKTNLNIVSDSDSLRKNKLIDDYKKIVTVINKTEDYKKLKK